MSIVANGARKDKECVQFRLRLKSRMVVDEAEWRRRYHNGRRVITEHGNVAISVTTVRTHTVAMYYICSSCKRSVVLVHRLSLPLKRVHYYLVQSLLQGFSPDAPLRTDTTEIYLLSVSSILTLFMHLQNE